MSFRDEIKKHADKHWFQPCADGLVWVSYKGIDVRRAIAEQKPPGQWTGAFLNYTSGGTDRAEGLFLIKTGEQAAALKTWNVESCPSAVMLATFHDKRKDDPNFPPNKPPKDFGLNDCTHFTSECVVTGGGLPAALLSIDAGQFFNSLYASSTTKTLARVVPIEDARKIIEAPLSPFKTGDVIIYSGGPTDHHHGVVHMGAGAIAMHTISIHRSHPTLSGSAFWDRLSGDAHHNKVTLYHFNLDDTVPTTAAFMPGWWRVTQGSDTWYYFFDLHNARVMYTERAPTNLKAAPGAPDGKGYWFEDGNFLSLCWSHSGTFERFTFAPAPSVTTLKGTSNGAPGLVATKL
ncbi:MAG TPA: hypothetical protein VGP07_06835 [Polyangia bacterium]|jgi:hypothetical protein